MKTEFMVALCLCIAIAPTAGAAQQADMSSVNDLYNECIDIWKQGGDCEPAQPIVSSDGDS